MACLMSLSCLASAQTSWTQQVSNTDSTLWDVCFANDAVGYACGNYGIILKTTNGGKSWVSQNSGTTSQLGSIHFLDAENGYISGFLDSSVVLKTTNGGNTWNIVLNIPNKHAGGLWFVNPDTGIVGLGTTAYTNSKILKTRNGGTTWDTVYSTGWISYFYFPDSKDGYATGSLGTILRTSNGGDTWDSVNVGGSPWMSGVYFSDKSNGFVGGGNYQSGSGELFKTTDGGNTWQGILTSGAIAKIFFMDTSTGYAINADFSGAGTLLMTTDGGGHWNPESTPRNGIRGIFLTHDGTGYAVGDSGLILSTLGPTKVDDRGNIAPAQFTLEQNYPNPFNPSTVISYQLSVVSNVTLKVYDVLGREVETLINQRQAAGSYSVTFNAAGLPSGVYFYRLQTGTYTATKKLMLLK